jgi:hypothetical protein
MLGLVSLADLTRIIVDDTAQAMKEMEWLMC